MQTMRNTFSGPLSTIPACLPPFTRGQGAVIRRIGGRGHFRSCDENGGQAIRSAIPENPMLRKLYGCIFYRTTGVIAD